MEISKLIVISIDFVFVISLIDFVEFIEKKQKIDFPIVIHKLRMYSNIFCQLPVNLFKSSCCTKCPKILAFEDRILRKKYVFFRFDVLLPN